MLKFNLASLFVDGRAAPAIGLPQGFWLFSPALLADYPDLKAVFQDWDAAFERLKAFAADCAQGGPGHHIAIAEAKFDLPIRFPNKLVGVGANYHDHLEEMGLPSVRFDPMPIFFMPPTTCLVGPGRTVKKPRTTEQFDWEIELTMVIGQTMKDADLQEAGRGVAGYTILLDMSARDLIQIGPPFYVDLVRGKAQDTMAPCGPVILPAEFVDDIRDLALKLYVNDELRQDGTTANMIFTIEEIVSHVSKYVTLEPGDLVTSGSPAGSGVHHNYFLKGGDRIRAEISGIGSLDVEIIDEALPDSALRGVARVA